MATFLQLIAANYLILIWVVFWGVMSTMPRVAGDLTGAIGFITAIALSIPAAILYAFGQVVSDVRKATGHLQAIRTYYEGAAPSSAPERW